MCRYSFEFDCSNNIQGDIEKERACELFESEIFKQSIKFAENGLVASNATGEKILKNPKLWLIHLISGSDKFNFQEQFKILE